MKCLINKDYLHKTNGIYIYMWTNTAPDIIVHNSGHVTQHILFLYDIHIYLLFLKYDLLLIFWKKLTDQRMLTFTEKKILILKPKIDLSKQ